MGHDFAGADGGVVLIVKAPAQMEYSAQSDLMQHLQHTLRSTRELYRDCGLYP